VFPDEGARLFHGHRVTSTTQPRYFRRSYLKVNKVSKSKGTRKVEHAVIFKSVLMLFTKNYQN